MSCASAATDPEPAQSFVVNVAPGFSLARSCAPVSWAKGRWPNEDWIDDAFWSVGWEGTEPVWRRVRQLPGGALEVSGNGSLAATRAWFDRAVFLPPADLAFSDQVIERLRQRYPGTGGTSHGSVFEGLVMCIVGQSISLAAAGTVSGRVSALFNPGMVLAGRTFWPSPLAAQLAAGNPALIRQTGVTTRRAQTLVLAAQLFVDRPELDVTKANPDLELALLALPGIGRWTVASTLLWGIGEPDVYPPNDVALLRAARKAYDQPDLDFKTLAKYAEQWLPHRAIAARLLWLDLFGVPGDERPDGGEIRL